MKTASVTKAARAAKIERTLHYRWLVEDPEYAKTFAAARLEAGEVLEDEAVRRAVEGLLEPLTFQGHFTYPESAYMKDEDGNLVLKKGAKPLSVRKYDSGLLMKLLDGFLPERYKRRGSVDVKAEIAGAIQVEAKALEALSDDELAALAAIARKLSPEEK